MSINVETATHPLQPLRVRDITAGVARMRDAGVFGPSHRIHGVELVEPEDKALVLEPGGARAGRSLRFVVLDRVSGSAQEVVVPLERDDEPELTDIRDGQPAITLEEFDRA
jgi:Cu2+-containing amine oxidase